VLPRYGFKKPDKSITQQFIGRPKGIKFSKEEIDYVKGDVSDLLKVRAAQEYLLKRDELLDVALLEFATVYKMARMKTVGIGWSSTRWMSIANENEKEYASRMAKLPKVVANWNSPKQVKDYFKSQGVYIGSFDDLQEAYAQSKNNTLKNFIEARELHKSITSYGKNWFTENFCDPDGRIRCDVQQIINTGRMSMMNPNLQQLPAKGKHRSAFVAGKGCKFVIGDFSGQEMGIMAAGAGENIWIDAMLRGDDIHALTASLLYAEQWKQATEKGCTFPKKCSCKGHKALREPTKILNFMLAYGGGPTKFAENTGCTFEEAKAIVKRYKRVVARLTMWLQNNAREALKTGVSFSADPYKRRRVLRGEEDWQIENQGKNNPIQAAGANMLKLAMISIPDQYEIVLVIHDEIILEVKNSEAGKAAKMLKKVMEDSATFITGIKGLIKVEPRIADDLTKV
jgi:DNA polymerase-1